MIVRIAGSDGKLSTAEYRGHRIVMDQPPEHGGGDRGPEPVVLLAAGLGGCIHSSLHAFLSRHGVATGGIEIDVEMVFADDPRRVGTWSVGVRLPRGVEERYLKALERVAASCVVHHTLAMGARIEVELERPEDDPPSRGPGHPGPGKLS